MDLTLTPAKDEPDTSLVNENIKNIAKKQPAEQNNVSSPSAASSNAGNDDATSFSQLNPSISDPTTELTEEDIFRMKSMSIDKNGWKNGSETKC